MKKLIFKQRPEMTRGERQQVFGIGGVAIASEFLAFGFILLNRSQYDALLSDPRLAFVPVIAAISTLVGVYFAMPWLGGRGALGATRAWIGCFVVLFLTIGFSTVLTAVLFGVGLGALVTGLLAAEWSILPALWIVAIWACHEMFKLRKSERNSIYSARSAVSDRMLESSELYRLALPDTLPHQRAKWMGY